MDSKNDEVAGHVSLRSKPEGSTPEPSAGDTKPEAGSPAAGTDAAESSDGTRSVEQQIAEIERAAEEQKAQIRKAAEAKHAEEPAAEAKAEEPPAEEPKAEDATAETPKAEGSTAAGSTGGASKAAAVAAPAAAAAAAAAAAKPAEDPKSEEKPAEESKAEESKAGEAKADEKPAAEPTPEEKTSDEVTAAEPASKTEPEAKTNVATADADTKTDAEGDKTESAAGDSDKAAGDAAVPASAGGGGGEPPDSTTPGSGSGFGGRFPLPKSVKAKVISAVVVVLVIALAVGGVLYYRGTHVPDGVALRVDGQDITVAQLNDEVQTQKALLGFEVPKDGPKADEFRRVFAKSIAFTTVIEKAAADRNVVVADRQVSDVLARVISQNYGDGPDGHDKSVQAMAANGTSEPKVLAEIKRQMTVTQLIQQVTAGIQASDQDVQQYFDTHKAELATPERRDIHNIVVKDKAAADQIVAQLNTGANFEQLAQQQSMDSTTKDKGGDLGPQPAQAFEPEFAKAAFAAPVNGVFGPVQGTHGYNVGRVVEVLPGAPAVFAQIKDPVRQQVIAERGAEKWRQFLQDAVKNANVVYADDYRPADPDSLPAPGDPQQQGAAPAGAPAPPK